MITIEDLAVYCKKKGFVFPSSDIYGGMAGFWDYGPLGVELFNNIKQHFWHRFVRSKEHLVGIDASIISHPHVWKASGHVDSFGDLVVACSTCKTKHRADHLIEEILDINVEGKPIAKINEIIKINNIVCPECKGTLQEINNFNLLFTTKVGAKEDSSSVAYLRGETAQGMFYNFRMVLDTTRKKLPFGIAQVGKTFRNEISPRDFMFRSREFTIAELEFFIHPNDKKCPLLTKNHLELSFQLLDAKTQDEKKKTLTTSSINELIRQKKLGEWHAYWLAEQYWWLLDLGLSAKKLKIREHTKSELSHYSSATFDIDYTYPFGSKELAGNANRGQYDLTQHIEFTKQKLTYYDEDTKEHVIPRVIEPTFGLDRVFLAVLCDAFSVRKDEKGNEVTVLQLNPTLAPIQVAVLPLVNKLDKEARKVFENIQRKFACTYDKSGSIGRRYARADELGVPFCVTIDFDTLNDQCVTVRLRDTAKQERVQIKNLSTYLMSQIIR